MHHNRGNEWRLHRQLKESKYSWHNLEFKKLLCTQWVTSEHCQDAQEPQVSPAWVSSSCSPRGFVCPWEWRTGSSCWAGSTWWNWDSQQLSILPWERIWGRQSLGEALSCQAALGHFPGLPGSPRVLVLLLSAPWHTQPEQPGHEGENTGSTNLKGCTWVTSSDDQLLQDLCSQTLISVQDGLQDGERTGLCLFLVWIGNFFKVTLSSSLQQFSSTELPARKVGFFPLCSFHLTSAPLPWYSRVRDYPKAAQGGSQGCGWDLCQELSSLGKVRPRSHWHTGHFPGPGSQWSLRLTVGLLIWKCSESESCPLCCHRTGELN